MSLDSSDFDDICVLDDSCSECEEVIRMFCAIWCVLLSTFVVNYAFYKSQTDFNGRNNYNFSKKNYSAVVAALTDIWHAYVCVGYLFIFTEKLISVKFAEKNNMAAVELTPIWAGSRKIKPMWILLRGHFVGFAHYPKRWEPWLHHGTWDNDWNRCSGRELTQKTELPMTRMVRSAFSQAVSSA